MKNYGIILASGTGSRYGDVIPKQFVKIAGKTILEHTIEIFEKTDKIDEIIVVITPEYRNVAENILLNNSFKKITKLLNGGETRKDSSYIGISSIDDAEANVLIHDCARPFLSQKIIEECVLALEKYDAVDVAIPSTDTIIKVNDNIIESVPERASLMRGQTPQCFKLSLIKKAHELAKNDVNFTDDCGLVIKYNLSDICVVQGSTENIKVTYPSDIFMADRLFQIRSTASSEVQPIEKINGKVIVIFGGTSGIGKCTAELAQKLGARVYSYSIENGCDVSDYKQVESGLNEVFQKENKIDYVINTAGVLKMGKLTEQSAEDIENVIKTNYLGSINVAKASIPYLKETKGGILMFASSSYTRGRAMYSTYSSTKAGVVNLVQALAEELICDNVRINAINPERTATPMRLKAFGKEPDESLLSPQKVAEATLKTLLSELTGQVVDVRKD